MAKYECHLSGDFNLILNLCHDTIMNKSASASFEDESYFEASGIRVCVRVYERYSAFGGNRLSMTLTVAGDQNGAFVSAITAGGSQGVFLKFNTVGEETFLQTLSGVLESYSRN